MTIDILNLTGLNFFMFYTLPLIISWLGIIKLGREFLRIYEVHYLRECISLFCLFIYSIIPIFNIGLTFVTLYGFCVSMIVKWFNFLEKHKKVVIYRRKK